MAMLPSSLQSPDPVPVVFGIINSLFFSGLFHGPLLSSGRQKTEQSRFVNVDALHISYISSVMNRMNAPR